MTHSEATKAPALWQQLQVVAQVLVQVRQGASATTALQTVAAPLRPGVQALLYHVLRHLGRAQALRAKLVQRPPAALPDALLCVALALAWDEHSAPYPSHTLVNQAVEAAKRLRSLQGQANFINACLRRFLRERDACVSATHDDPQALWNHPLWWIRKLQHQYPQHWQHILQANNQAAPMTWRVNTARMSRDDLLRQWQAAGLDAVPVGQQGLTLAHARPVREVPGFEEGWCSVQDAAAQCAAQCLLEGIDLQAPSKLRVLDACAAPGGKTAHVLELLQSRAELVALDIDAQRSDRIHQNLQRMGLSAQVIAADAAKTEQWWDGQAFDLILLDAPCTASGIVRRHPDVRWLRRESDVTQLAAIQKQLLQKLWPLLKEGGRLLYCTCSVFHEEGQAQAKAFVQHNTDAKICPSLGHLRPQTQQTDAVLSDNLPGDHDGFYYALFEKHAAAR